MTDSITDWLRAQLDEDERIARALNPDPVASMARKLEADALHLREELKAGKSDRVAYDEGQADALHWAATVLPERMPALSPFGQARVLRELDAKRKLLDEHQDVNDGSCGTCVDGKWGYPTHGGSTPQQFPCRTLRLLALPYADRPGYRDDWRP